MRNDEMLMLKGLLGGLLQTALFAAMLLLPAGTWYWPRALQFLSLYGIVVLLATVLLARFSPASLEARFEPPVAKNQPKSDRIITLLLIPTMLAWFVFIPVDVFRLQLFPPPGLAVSSLGVLMGVAGFVIVMLALFQNAYAVPIVRVQSERDQILIDTGLYGLVRHPFYMGLLLFFAGIALWLESYASVLSLSIVLALLAARMLVEERTLCEELPGYIEYMGKVRYRLVPFVW